LSGAGIMLFPTNSEIFTYTWFDKSVEDNVCYFKRQITPEQRRAMSIYLSKIQLKYPRPTWKYLENEFN
jgi:hypothetical protein